MKSSWKEPAPAPAPAQARQIPVAGCSFPGSWSILATPARCAARCSAALSRGTRLIAGTGISATLQGDVGSSAGLAHNLLLISGIIQSRVLFFGKTPRFQMLPSPNSKLHLYV